MRAGTLPVFRVCFCGPLLDDVTVEALEETGIRWEGSASRSDDSAHRHRALVGASDAEEASRLVSSALRNRGDFQSFSAAPVTTHLGKPIFTPIRKAAWEIDWEQVLEREAITELQQAAVQEILDAAEPTWIIVTNLGAPHREQQVHEALADLVKRGLVIRTQEMSGQGPDPFAATDWWALSDRGWDLLGLIKSPRYH